MSYGKKSTDAWQLYELGKQYNQQLVPNQYNLVNTNIEFFIGNQWKGLHDSGAMAALPKPVFNIIKRVTSLFVASLTSSSSKISFEPLANKIEVPVDEMTDATDPEALQSIILEDDEAVTASQMATSEVENLWEKLKMDARIREALFDGAQTGDYCAHFYWDANSRPYGGAYGAYRGEIKMELVDGVNVMFGNPNTHIVEDQPYILIIGRDLVSNLRAEYLAHHKGDQITSDSIQSDRDYEWQVGDGGHVELGDSDKTGKAIFCYMYTKKSHEEKVFNKDGTPKMERVLDKNGNPVQAVTPEGAPIFDLYGEPVWKEKQMTEVKTTVWVSKHTKFTDIYEPIDTGLTYYPIAWGNWERQTNQYHGRALVTGIIPNQIYINSMFALIMRHQQMLGFPKVLYDADVLGQWNNAVGQAIAVYGMPDNKRMSDLHSVIQPADMSTQIMRCIEMAMAYTKECLGATDAQLGNVRPDNTSALIALQSSSQVPLENPQALKYDWIEDIGRILLDMMGTYYGKRPVVRREEKTDNIVDPTTGQPTTMTKQVRVIEMYDFSKLKDIWLNIRADVGASTYWSRIAVVQTLDNLKQAGVLDVLDYLERMPDEYIPRKDELIAKLRRQLQDQQAAQPATPAAAPEAAGPVPVPGPEATQFPQNPDTGAVQGVAWGADAPNNTAALVASMPDSVQQQYNTFGNRVKKTLLRQQENTLVGI